MPIQWLAFSLAACLVGLPTPQQGSNAAVKPIRAEELTLEKVFRSRPYAGQQARGASFSHQGRYLAYLWNPYGENGTDLYIYDTQTGQARRVTSLEKMKEYDTPEAIERFLKKAGERDRLFAESQDKAEAQAAYLRGVNIDLDKWDMAAIEALKLEAAEKKAKQDAEKEKEKEREKEKQESEKNEEQNKEQDEVQSKDNTTPESEVKKADSTAKKDKDIEKELWEWRDELKKKQEKETPKPADMYPGVSALKWANKADELIFVYRGDLFRYTVPTEKTERLTSTDRVKQLIGYSSSDEGYIFQNDARIHRDDTGIFKVDFDSGRLVQLNRALVFADDAEKKYNIQGTTLSEDGRWMAIYAQLREESDSAQSAQRNQGGRQVQIMDYRKRFAESRQERREVSDDKLRTPATAVYIRKVDEAPTPQPEPIFTNDGGDVWFERTPVSWSKDGSKYAFATWEREKELLKIYLGEASETEKPQVALESKGDTGHEVINSLAPKFTPDGKTLVVALDATGFRQPWAMDVADKSIRPVLKGDFEAHTILGFTPDSEYMFLLANKDDFAAMNVFKVNIATGEMERIGKAEDFHRNPAVSENGAKVAMNSGNWLKRNELHVVDVATKDTKILTDSHDKTWPQVNVLQPMRFSYTNRHGDKIQAYMFKPKGWSPSDKRPAIVYIYGGPLGDRHSVEVDSFQPTGYMFGMYMAAKHGYVTITVDTRGHSNYGRRFSGANWEQPGLPQTEDLEDLMKLIRTGYGIDIKRVGLTGWSFGGFQTQYTMYTKPDLFACGISGAAPTEWENYNSWYSGRTIGKVDRTKPVLRKYSLLPMAKNLRKPLLLVHGMADPNVLYQDTVNVYRTLLENGKESIVDLFLDPEGEHSMGGAVKTRGWHKKYEAFFIQHLGKGK